jgi:hypothetical protein
MLDTYIYNKTDGSGWCFTSFCNVTCHVEKHATLCISTTPPPPPPTTTSPPPSTTTSQSTTEENSSFTTPPPKNCDFLTPPRKVRSWNLNQIEGILIHQHTLTNDIYGKYTAFPDII